MSDKKNEIDVDEAPLSIAQQMKSHATSDAWKDAKDQAQRMNGMSSNQSKPTNTPRSSPQAQKKDPSWYDPNNKEFQYDPKQPKSDLKLSGEGSAAANVSGFQAPLTDEDRMKAVRELIKNKVKEVVRKKPGGGGFALYAPNKGKKGKPRAVGNFPTKLGAKRAELARFPPKDPGKLRRLRKEVDKLTKNPKKAAEKERQAAKAKSAPTPKKEGVNEAGDTPFSSGTAKVPPFTLAQTEPRKQEQEPVQGGMHKDVVGFMNGLKTLPKTGPARGKYITAHMNNADFQSALQKHPQGKQISKQLNDFMNSLANAGPKNNATVKVTPAPSESVQRRVAFMERKVISTIIKKSLTESLFREEKTESEWDDYISKLSKSALAGDSKFQTLQRNISKKTESILDDAFNTIKKAVGKNVKLKSYGIKHDANSGQTYLSFGASFEDVSAEPIYIHVEGGVPKIDVSQNAKVALTKADPSDAKLFRAELVTVQERVLDNMDELSGAIQNRDKYLGKLENEVDGYVAGLSPLQVSLLKQLLVKKYRKIT